MNGNLKPWPKGVSGNPSGLAPRLPPEVRAERKKNQAALVLLVSKLFSLNPEAAKENTQRKDVTQLEQSAQGMIDKAIAGDTPAFKYLMELICGKLPETDPESVAEQMTASEKLDIMKRAVAALEAQAKNESG